MKVEGTDKNAVRDKSWWKHGDGRNAEFEGYVNPDRWDISKPPKSVNLPPYGGPDKSDVRQTMGIVIPTNLMGADVFDEEDDDI